MRLEGWIDNNMGKILLFFLILFCIEGAIWCWKMPEGFKSTIIPKLEDLSNIERRVKTETDRLNTSIVNNKIQMELMESTRGFDRQEFYMHTHRHYDGHIK